MRSNQQPHTFWSLFPFWARPTNIIYQHVRARLTTHPGRMWYVLRWSLGLSVLAIVVILSATAFEQNHLSGLYQPGDWYIYNVLYVPLLIVQDITISLALLIGRGTLLHEYQPTTWEVFKVTSHGIGFVVRARWATIFYQLRWLLLVIMVSRLGLLGLMLVDLTGCYNCFGALSMTGIAPDVSPVFAVVLVAAFMTAAVLQILMSVGFNGALGIFIGIIFRKRVTSQLASVIILMTEIGLMGLALAVGQSALDRELTTHVSETTHPWGILLGLGAWGDQGLRFMDFHTLLRTWLHLPYGVYLGLALLGIVILQAVITNLLLLWTCRWASRPARA